MVFLMEIIKDTVYRLMQQLDSRQKNSQSDAISEWLEKTLSAKERKHINSYFESKGVLRFKVDSSSWIYYLSLKKEALLNSIRQSLPRVKEIHFSASGKNEKTKNKRT